MKDRVRAVDSGGDVRMSAAQEAEEFIEPALIGSESGSVAEVPLPEHPRGVAGCLQALGEGLLAQRESERRRFRADRARVKLVPEALLIAAGQ